MGSRLCSRGTSSFEFRDLWPCGSVTLWPLSVYVSVKVSHKQLLKYFILVTSETHIRCWFKSRTIFSFLFLSNNISAQHSYTTSRLESRTSLPSFSHVVYFDTALRQESWKGERQGDMAIAIFNLFFSRKKRNAEARLPGTALGQGSCCACVHTHAHTISQLSTVLRKHP